MGAVSPRLTPAAAWSMPLAGADDVVRAHLVPGGRPAPNPNLLSEFADPPEVTDEDHTYRVRAAPAPQPDGVLAATRQQLIGHWVPAEGSGLEAQGPTSLVLGADGRWSHGEGLGCPSSGRWAVGSDGRLLTTIGPVPAVFCPGVSVANWFLDGSRAGFAAEAADVLVLLTPRGHKPGGSLERSDGALRAPVQRSLAVTGGINGAPRVVADPRRGTRRYRAVRSCLGRRR